MNQWIKLDSDLLDDPRIQRLLDSKLGYAGLGIYLSLRLRIASSRNERKHLNQLLTIDCKRAGFQRTKRVLEDFNLFWRDGNGEVSLRASDHASDNAGEHASDHAGDKRIEKNRKEINKEKVFVNGNHDFDPRWD